MIFVARSPVQSDELVFAARRCVLVAAPISPRWCCWQLTPTSCARPPGNRSGRAIAKLHWPPLRQHSDCIQP